MRDQLFGVEITSTVHVDGGTTSELPSEINVTIHLHNVH